MTEVEATVESEFVPEPKWPEQIVIYQQRGAFKFASYLGPDSLLIKLLDKDRLPYRIIRAQPPVERRVSIDWEAVVKEVHGAFNKLKGIGNLGVVAHELRGHVLQELIQRHARIVEVSKP